MRRALISFSFAATVSTCFLCGCIASRPIPDSHLNMITAQFLQLLPQDITVFERVDVDGNVTCKVKDKQGKDYRCMVSNQRGQYSTKCWQDAASAASSSIYVNQSVQPTRISARSSGTNVSAAIKKTKDPRLNTMIDSATPILEEVLPKMACTYDYGLLQRYLVRYIVQGSHAAPPMMGMKYHNNNSCLRIERVSEWKILSKNAMSLRAVFVADDSGESSAISFKMIQQDDGSWLIEFY